MLRGREAEAARNDQRVLDAARAVLLESADASVSSVAARAGVGVASVYRRYPNREALVVAVLLEAMSDVADLAAKTSDVAAFMRAALEGGGGTMKSMGTVLPSAPELGLAKERLHDAIDGLVARAQAAGTLRPDVGAADLSLALEQVSAIRVADDQRTGELRRRALEIALAGLRSDHEPLPGPTPTWAEIAH